MTITEFFRDLYQKAEASDIPDEYLGKNLSDKAVLLSNLKNLINGSHVQPKFWKDHFSAHMSSWRASRDLLLKYKVTDFSEFKGDADLKKNLKAFLGG